MKRGYGISFVQFRLLTNFAPSLARRVSFASGCGDASALYGERLRSFVWCGMEACLGKIPLILALLYIIMKKRGRYRITGSLLLSDWVKSKWVRGNIRARQGKKQYSIPKSYDSRYTNSPSQQALPQKRSPDLHKLYSVPFFTRVLRSFFKSDRSPSSPPRSPASPRSFT